MALVRLATAVMPRGIQNLPTEGEFGVITGDSKRQGVLRNWYAPDRWPRWLVYVFAIAAVAVTVFLRLTIGEIFSQRPLLILFVLPILMSAYLGGLGPGLLATLAAAFGVIFLLIPPAYSFAIDKSADLIQWLMLIVSGVCISVLTEAPHRFRRRVETSRLLQAVTLASIGDAVITTDARGRITFLNPAAERLTGWQNPEAIGLPLAAVFRVINEQTRQPMADPVENVLESGQAMGMTNHTLLLARDGRELAIADRAAPIRQPGGPMLGVVLVCRDCSEARRAEAALRSSETHYRSLFENMPDGFVYGKMLFENGQPQDFIHVDVNRAFETLTGLHDVVGKRASEVMPDLREANPEFFAIHGRVVQTGNPESFEMYVRGLNKWIAATVYSPEKEHFVAVFDDVTERQRVEEEGRLSLGFLETVQRHTEIPPLLEEFVSVIKDYTGADAVGIRVLDSRGNIPYQAYQGFSRSFYEQESPLSIHADHCMCINVIKGACDPALPFYSAGGSFYMNGTSRFLATVAAADKGATRNVCNQVGYESVALIPFRRGRDILGLIHVADHREDMVPLHTVEILEKAGMQLGTAFLRLKAEATLRDSEEHYRSLFENMLNGFAYCRMHFEDGRPVDFTYLSVNRAFENLTGLKDVTGKKVSEVIPGLRESDPALFAIYGRVAATGVPERFETYVNALSMWFSVSVYCPSPEHFVAIFEVITERKQAEEALAKSLSEKTALLKEVHHRVKNNLQIVASLLRLQAGRSPHPEVLEVLENTRHRVHSMALLHETLYRSDNLARINFAAYVEELCRHLRRSAGAVMTRVTLENKVAPLGLPLDQSLPCGLIINELLSNALKHAFPGDRQGLVTVTLEPAPDKQLVLRVTDNGVGPPPVKDLTATPTLGLRLISGLASQLGGKLTVDQPDGIGTAFQVVFPAPGDAAIEDTAA